MMWRPEPRFLGIDDGIVEDALSEARRGHRNVDPSAER